jgi:hypothetical protein
LKIQGTEEAMRTFVSFMFASRGVWSLFIFLMTNWMDLKNYYDSEQEKHRQQQESIASNNDPSYVMSPSSPPKEEEELVQLNIALQKEIVRFTAIGIQRAVKEIDELMHSSGSHSGSRTSSLANSLYFFKLRLPGDAVSFVVDDSDIVKTPSRPASTNIPSSTNLAGSPNPNPSIANPSVSANPGGEPHSPTVLTVGTPQNNYSHHFTENPLTSYELDHMTSKTLSSEDGMTGKGWQSYHSSEVRKNSSNLQPSDGDLMERDRRKIDPSTDQVDFNMKTNAVIGATNTKGERTSQQRRSSTHTADEESKISLRILQQLEKLKQRIVSPRTSFVFTDFSPKRFAKIRALSNISVESYLTSFRSTTMPQFSEGKSGAFLYFSSDYNYIVKTTTPKEFEKLLSMLPAYEKYIEKEKRLGRDSLLTRYLGAHRIIMYDIPLYFVVMKHVCPNVDEKYDLKGSWINRHGSKMQKDRRGARPKKNYSLMISNNSIERIESKSKDGSVAGRFHTNNPETTPLFLDNDLQNCFLLHPSQANELAAQIDRDTRFLESKKISSLFCEKLFTFFFFFLLFAGFNLMDYSLLIGVRRKTFFVTDHLNHSDTVSSFSTSMRSTMMGVSSAPPTSITNSLQQQTPSPLPPRQSGSKKINVGEQQSQSMITPVQIGKGTNNATTNTQSFVDLEEQPRSTNTNPVEETTPFLPNTKPYLDDENTMIPAAAVEGAGSFQFGIIDTLQDWNWAKWNERLFKTVVLRKDGAGLSAIDPKSYRERFIQRAVLDIFAAVNYDPKSDYHPEEEEDGDDGFASNRSSRHKWGENSHSKTTNANNSNSNAVLNNSLISAVAGSASPSKKSTPQPSFTSSDGGNNNPNNSNITPRKSGSSLRNLGGMKEPLMKTIHEHEHDEELGGKSKQSQE